ncbi:hypothetical protein ACFWMQ_04975 [Streptomyces sp. NPDC058372]|uniref:hypothetical protein n=1 Tax=Streptomyces sp. NPDC058372 TaxID=3346464 RepID=UPI00365CC016
MSESLREQLGTGDNFKTRVTILSALVSFLPLIGISFLTPPSGRQFVFYLYYAFLTACFLHLLWILKRNIRPIQRPPLLTRDLFMGFFLFIPSLLSSFWPGIVGGPLFALLVGATSVLEKVGDRDTTSG